jgi:hypothetical protein
MTPEKRLIHLKITLLALSITAMALVSAALILHSTNNMLTSDSELNHCLINITSINDTKSTAKDSNVPTLITITTVMLSVGIFFSLSMAIFLIAWLCKKSVV